MARIIDGKAVAAEVREQVAVRAGEFRARYDRAPGLHVILVGDDPASQVYVRSKETAARAAGLASVVHRRRASTSTAELSSLVAELNGDPAVDGILVQLPLPAAIDARAVLTCVDSAKDVDGLSPTQVGRFWLGEPALVPCTPRGCMRLLAAAGVTLSGARALVLGRSNIVGKPLANLLLQADATVTLAHSRTLELAERCREADILIAAIGKPRYVKGEWIKPGAAVIDVGINRDENGKLCGDVDFASAEPRAGVITPVPGGVGPMTIAMLLDNTLQAAERRLSGENQQR